MNYSGLESVLKRYSFEEKMRVAQIYSRQALSPIGIRSVEKLSSIPLPWELETFVLFSIKSFEWKRDEFRGPKFKEFERIIDCIRDEQHPVIKESEDRDFVTKLFIGLGATQFEIQEDYRIKLYRYNYFFSFVNDNIDMKKLFAEKFGCTYYQYLLMGTILRIAFCTKEFNQEIFVKIIKMFEIPFFHLSISRQEYIDKLDGITDDIENYLYCLRPSYSYPFVEYKGTTYCPLPHLLIRAITSSLMHRLTDGNNDLMGKIGKEVYESYLYSVIKESDLFDEVIPEQVYGKKSNRTVDVMTRKGDNYVFFDSKSFTPKIRLRHFSVEDLDKDVDRLADSCVQVYKHIRKHFPEKYCFFEKKPESVNDNIFGLVVVQEDPRILNEMIYKRAAEKLCLELEDQEYKWLFLHVGIVSIYNIEEFCFSKTDIVEELIKNKETGKLNSFWLNKKTGETRAYDSYRLFLDSLKSSLLSEYQNALY